MTTNLARGKLAIGCSGRGRERYFGSTVIIPSEKESDSDSDSNSDERQYRIQDPT